MNSSSCFRFVIVPVVALFMAALPSINAQTSPAPLRTYGETGESFCLGPSQIVRTDLGKMKVSDRAGNTLYQDDVDDWWNTKAGGSSRRPSGLAFAFDPVLHRWIAAAYDEYRRLLRKHQCGVDQPFAH